jgi:hypothetical protein
VGPDPSLQRIERTAVMMCLGMTASAWALGGTAAALGVVGGGLLSAFSYRTIVSAVTALTPVPVSPTASGTPAKRPKLSRRSLLNIVLRYALLALLAYVMIARLRLHPLGLLAGASSVVVAIALEAVRAALKKP